MIIAYGTQADEGMNFIRLNGLKKALLDLLGLEVTNNDIDEDHLVLLVKERLESNPDDRSREEVQS